jgi:hypothetical protein
VLGLAGSAPPGDPLRFSRQGFWRSALVNVEFVQKNPLEAGVEVVELTSAAHPINTISHGAVAAVGLGYQSAGDQASPQTGASRQRRPLACPNTSTKGKWRWSRSAGFHRSAGSIWRRAGAPIARSPTRSERARPSRCGPRRLQTESP